MKNDLQRHTKRDRIRWAIASILFVLMIVLLTGLILQVFGMGKVKPSEWFKKQDDEKTEQTEGVGAESAAANFESHTKSASTYATTSAYDFYDMETYHSVIDYFLSESGVVDVTEQWFPYFVVDGFFKREELKNNIRVLELPAATYQHENHIAGGKFGSVDYIKPSVTGYYLFIPSYTSSTAESLISETVTTNFSSRGIEISLSLSDSNSGYVVDDSGSVAGRIYHLSRGVGTSTTQSLNWYKSKISNCPFIKVLINVPYSSVNISNYTVPEKEGYTATGWYKDILCTQPVTGSSVYADESLYAGYEGLHVAAFDTNGSNTIAPCYVNAGQTLGFNPIVPVKTDCTFLGWSYDGSDTYTDISGVVMNSSKMFTAVWREPVELPADPVKEGYTFVGWYYDEEFSRPYDGEPLYTDTQLYAKFVVNEYTVTFDSDGGTAVESQTVNWNTAATLTTPTKEKHAFVGWFLPNGTRYTNQPIKENIILTAHWSRNVFNVTFNSNGGSEVEEMEVNLNASISLPTVTKTGYDFVGWYLSDGTEYTDQAVTNDVTLTARWKIQTFTVTFMVDGAVYETVTVEYGTKLEHITQSAEPVLFALYAESELGVGLAADYAIDGDITVYAEKGTTAQKVQGNWWKILIGGVAGAAVLALFCSIPSMVKHKKRK